MFLIFGQLIFRDCQTIKLANNVRVLAKAENSLNVQPGTNAQLKI
jgi:hypothetical protein